MMIDRVAPLPVVRPLSLIGPSAGTASAVAVVARSDSALQGAGRVVPVIVDAGLAGPRRSGSRRGSAGDGGGCGRLSDDGERFAAEAGQDVGGVSDDPAGL
jgi:hypothetical protein